MSTDKLAKSVELVQWNLAGGEALAAENPHFTSLARCDGAHLQSQVNLSYIVLASKEGSS